MAKVTITVRVILDPLLSTEDTLHIGFRGPGGWYEPSNDVISWETERKFKATMFTGPHYVAAITTAGADETVMRSARTVVGVGRKNKTVELRPK
jgi:hypothetical protein